MKLFSLILLFNLKSTLLSSKYEADWNSLDKRPLPTWYDDAKVGIFIHWGVFSVPAFNSEWFWWHWQGDEPQKDVVDYMEKNYPPDFTYSEFAKDFTAKFFDPDQWAELFVSSGAKYVVLTTKHHEGYCMWPSETSWNWNSKDIGPNRDIVGQLANSIRKKTNLTFGLYHSLYEWFNAMYLKDKSNNFTTQEFIEFKIKPELYDLINKYKPEVIWSDGDWETQDSYWNSREFLAWLYNESPVKNTVVVNDRWGAGDMCHHGDFYTCSDNYNPGKILKHKWENCMPLDKKSWGFRNNMELNDILTIKEIISSLTETVSCGGNILINIGPTKDGVIVPIFEERLRQLGSWLKINGEAIYFSRPWKYQNDTTNSDVWYTSRDDKVYAILLKYPSDSHIAKLSAPKVTKTTEITLLGYSDKINWTYKNGINIDLSSIKTNNFVFKWGMTFEMTNVI